ncbi:PREDICTED: uncharacterized protein LOC105569846 isoform X2 [Vollenhovia emeryi]|uniref:uncharacterized protein LOC105569846 isoform X2 n=1 Tax=Vollenhovia emeryi TaxID=411798 RepID=UPI0005F45A81|nr:PREDICTED: uncharacterized protein LOC105569846 isoform X2 [Vollenhovia emeryi]
MDFQTVNRLNVRINLISGNLFPMTTDNSRFSIGWKIYSAVTWLIIIAIIIAFSVGFMMVSKKKVISDGMIGTVFAIEVLFLVARIHMHKDLVKQLIQNVNDILRVQDETMRRVVRTSLHLVHSSAKFYWMSGIITVIIWIVMPLTAAFKKNCFIYEDYRLPLAISRQPFSTEMFLLGSLLLVFGSVYVILKKAAVDIYMLNFVMLMTAQYRYIAVKLEEIFRERNSQDKRDNFEKQNHPTTDSWSETEMKAVCRHHKTVVLMSTTLKKLLSSNFCLIYISSILRFSFVGVMLSNTALLKTVVERIAMVFFACGEILQFYILCLNVQKLLDAIMNQSYSITLLCLKLVKKE